MTFTMQLSGHFGARSTIRPKISATSVPGTLPIFLAVAAVQRHLVRGISPSASMVEAWPVGLA